MTSVKKTPKKVFISYCHETQKHQNRVLSLANQLRKDGVDCTIDQYEQAPHEGWPAWMDKKIRGSTFVLVFYTKTYHERAMGKNLPKGGDGVRFESLLTLQELYSRHSKNNKFIPIVYNRDKGKYIPPSLRSFQFHIIDTKNGYETLLRQITNNPRITPPPVSSISSKRTRSKKEISPIKPSQEKGNKMPNEISPKGEKLIEKKNLLKKLDKQINTAGGWKKSPSKLLVEYAEILREIEILEKHLSGYGGTTVSTIPAPIQFIDRPVERQLVEKPLRSKDDWVRTIVIQGMGGTGKTELAKIVAREVEGLFNKVIWASANDSPISLADLLDIVLRTIGHRSDQLTLGQKKERVSELFRDEPYLLVVDSFDRIGDKDVDKFIAENVFHPSKVLITTRHIWPQASSVIRLGGLTLDQTGQMLQEVGKSQNVRYKFSDDDVKRIFQITDGLPMALGLIIGQLSQGLPFNRIISSLVAPDEIEDGTMYNHLFGNSWNLLDESTQKVLMSMTFFAAPASEEAIQSISGDEKRKIRTRVDDLIRMSLIQPNRDSLGGDEFRLSIHPLTRQFATAKIDSQPEIKKEIYNAALNYFMRLMDELGRPGLESKKYDRLEQDLPNCLAAFEWSKSQKDNQDTLKIVEYLNHFLFERGFWNTRIQICAAAADLGHGSPWNPEVAWQLAFWAGWVCSRQNNYTEARMWSEKAQESLGKIPETNKFRIFYQAKISQLNALITHSEAVEIYKRNPKKSDVAKLFEQANEFHDKARSLLQEYIYNGGTQWGFEDPNYAIAIVDSNQGDLAVDMGHWKNSINKERESRKYYEEAQNFYSQVLQNAQNSNWKNRDAVIAFSAANLGHVEIWLEQKPLDQIGSRFQKALEISEHIGRIHTIAWCYRGYGLLKQRLGQKQAAVHLKKSDLLEARDWLRKALDIFEQIGRRVRVEETEEALKEVEAELKKLS